jgi:sirohydrochlorin cobaltochelatase
MPPQRGVVFFAHGSRDPLWRAPIEAVARALQQQQPDARCMCAYLELNTPDLASACQSLLEQGCTAITVLPMFLGTGRHARQDLPVLVAQLRQQHPQITFSIATAVGEDGRVTELLASIAAEHIA